MASSWPCSPAAAFVAGAALAGAEAPYHHVHLTTTNGAAAVEWYARHLDGEVPEGGGRVFFGDTLVLFLQREAGFEGSAGSSVDHIGFSFADLDAKMKEFEAVGIKILSPPRDVAGRFKLAFIEDPWGTKIEVMEDPELYGFHHIHLRAPDPEQILAWYESSFGGERSSFKGMIDGLRYGDVWLFVQNSGDEEPAPTEGRAIDHLSWSFPDLEAAAATLKERGVKFTIDPRPFRDFHIAFIEGPNGVRIELVETR
ncbi:MAG: VOC family protein [Myxococcota bacterium]